MAFPINRLIDRILYASTYIKRSQFIICPARIHPVTQKYINKLVIRIYPKTSTRKYNGGGTYWVNQGELKNTGVEFSVNTFPVKGTVTWETGFNAAYVKNEVTDLAGSDFVLAANYSDLGGAMQIMKPGYPMGSFYVYQWKGFDDKGANLYQKADGSLTTNPTSDDLVVKGQASPKWTVGWNNTVTWKNWTLNVFFNAATGYDRLNISRFMAASMTGVSRFITLRDAYFKGWDHVANKADALYPSLTNTDNKSYANSDFWLEDASFIKLKNISLQVYNCLSAHRISLRSPAIKEWIPKCIPVMTDWTMALIRFRGRLLSVLKSDFKPPIKTITV